MSRPEPEGKAAGFNSLVAAVRRQCSEEQWSRLVKMLSPETAALVEVPPLPIAWLPSKHGNEFMRLAHEVAFQRRDELLLQAAKAAMRADLNTLYKIFIRLASPQYVIERGTKLWDTYSRNNGSLTSRQTSDTTAEVRYQGIATSFPAFWIYQRGAIIGVLEATGLKQPRATLKSGGDRSSEAVIEAAWGS